MRSLFVILFFTSCNQLNHQHEIIIYGKLLDTTYYLQYIDTANRSFQHTIEQEVIAWKQSQFSREVTYKDVDTAILIMQHVFEQYGVEHYLIKVGSKNCVKGTNFKGEAWQIP